MVKNLPAMQETWVRSLGWEDALDESMTTHSSILACGQRSLEGYRPWCCKELEMTEDQLCTALVTLHRLRALSGAWLSSRTLGGALILHFRCRTIQFPRCFGHRLGCICLILYLEMGADEGGNRRWAVGP